jgi:hypothetical protein
MSPSGAGAGLHLQWTLLGDGPEPALVVRSRPASFELAAFAT